MWSLVKMRKTFCRFCSFKYNKPVAKKKPTDSLIYKVLVVAILLSFFGTPIVVFVSLLLNGGI